MAGVRTSEYNHHNNMISLEELCMNPTAIKSILPGLILCGILAFSAQALSNLPVLKGHFPVGAVMLAILLGTATRQFIPIGTSMEPGIRFAFKRVLRLGVAGLGFSLTFNDIEAVGFRGLLLDTALITGTYFCTGPSPMDGSRERSALADRYRNRYMRGFCSCCCK